MSRIAWRAAVPYLAIVVVAVGVLNFLWFMVETTPLNLIPSDGRVIDGHYYLWSKIRGGLVEVSPATYHWLPLHELTVFLTWPLVLLAGVTLVFRIFASRIAGDQGASGDAVRCAFVESSGPPIASARMAGAIGSTWFSRPLLRVTVHPGGIVVTPALMARRAILAAEIQRISPGGGLSSASSPDTGPLFGLAVREVPTRFRPRGPFLEIDHDGRGMASPLRLEGGRWDVAEAILSIRPSAEGAVDPSAGAWTPALPRDGDGTPDQERDGLPVWVWRAGIALGVVVTVSLIWSGITFAIPQLGPVGVLWTVGVIAIGAINLRRFLAGRH